MPILIIAFLMIVGGLYFLFFPQKKHAEPSATNTLAAIEKPKGKNDYPDSSEMTKITPEGLKIEIVKKGNGATAVAGKTVTVHYVGTLPDGTKFDSSRDRGKPFSFPLGAGLVIKGWDLGVAGMQVGEVRRLTIPPPLAYGTRGVAGAIPPNATLVFEVELLGVK